VASSPLATLHWSLNNRHTSLPVSSGQRNAASTTWFINCFCAVNNSASGDPTGGQESAPLLAPPRQSGMRTSSRSRAPDVPVWIAFGVAFKYARENGLLVTAGWQWFKRLANCEKKLIILAWKSSTVDLLIRRISVVVVVIGSPTTYSSNCVSN
jgi:hypothetical protein